MLPNVMCLVQLIHVSSMYAVMIQLPNLPPYSNCTASVAGHSSRERGYWSPVTTSEMFQTWQQGAL